MFNGSIEKLIKDTKFNVVFLREIIDAVRIITSDYDVVSCDIVWSKHDNGLQTYLNHVGAVADSEQIILYTVHRKDVDGVICDLKNIDGCIVDLIR